MNAVWIIMVVSALAAGIFSGKPSAVMEGAFAGAERAVEFIFSAGGLICLWSGILKIADASGAAGVISKLLSPITRLLFPRLSPDSAAMKNITLNMTANLLGTGNAATPAGIRAMEELEKLSPGGKCSREMRLFALINTASLQLIPSTVISLRQAAGSVAPAAVIPAVWAVSAAVFVCICALSALFSRRAE